MNTEASRQEKFNRLAEAYGTDLYRYAMWICGNDALAKDLVQETYLRAVGQWRNGFRKAELSSESPLAILAKAN